MNREQLMKMSKKELKARLVTVGKEAQDKSGEELTALMDEARTIGEKGEIPYTILTRPEKLVMDYCHINIYEVQEMEIDIYLFFLREAMIFENSQTEEGRKYLKDCFRMEQTKPDREGLRERFGKKGGKSSG